MTKKHNLCFVVIPWWWLLITMDSNSVDHMTSHFFICTSLPYPSINLFGPHAKLRHLLFKLSTVFFCLGIFPLLFAVSVNMHTLSLVWSSLASTSSKKSGTHLAQLMLWRNLKSEALRQAFWFTWTSLWNYAVNIVVNIVKNAETHQK